MRRLALVLAAAAAALAAPAATSAGGGITVFAAASLAQVELEVTEPARLVAVITRDAVEALELRPGMSATGVVKATSVMVER